MYKGCIRLVLCIFAIGLMFSVAEAQDNELFVPAEGTVFLNRVIAGDTTATGDRVNLDRVYVLQRDGAYLWDERMFNDFPVRIKAEDGEGARPIMVMVTNSGTGSFPSEFWRLEESLWLKDLSLVGFLEATNDIGNIPGGLIRTNAPGFDVVIDGCVLSQTRGQILRTQLATRVVKITNTIFANLGDLGRSNFGAGKGVDFRDTSCDTALFRNCTFVNFQDRPVRHRSSTGAINNFIFDHNTLINGMSYHGTLALGQVGDHVQITNNLFLDTFIAGQDTDAVRQSEFDESGELDAFGFGKMTWIFTEPVNDNTQFTVAGNYYSVSPAVQTFYDEVSATEGDAFGDEGSPLTDHILGKIDNDETAFIKEAIEVANRPEPMLAMARWYRDPAGANKTKETTNFVREMHDFDRRDLTYFVDTFDASYPTTAAAYTGGTDGLPAGDLNWFPGVQPPPVELEELFVAAEGTVFLNRVIAGDTTAAGERVTLDRVYVLQRGGAYLWDERMFNDFPVRIKAEDGDGARPIMVMVTNSETGSFPSEFWRLEESLWLKDLSLVGFLEATNDIGNIPGGLIRTNAPGFDVVIDGCVLSQTRGQILRTQLATRVVKITNTIFANLGDLGRSNFGAGKGVDFRDTSCDTALFRNCTFVNFQDRPVRHRSSTGAINNFIFDHNTLINGMSYHGTLALGQVGDHVQITNNLFLDTFIAGQDTDAVRQSEFDESGELDAFGFGKMTWIFTEPVNDNTQFTVAGNYYSVSPAVQTFYDEVSATEGDAFGDEGSPLTDHILGKIDNDETAFIKEAIEVANRPEPMLAMARWYRDPAGANKTKETTNFVREMHDFDRRDLTYFVDTFDASYPTTAAAYTGGTDGLPAGDLNWFPNITSVNSPEANVVEDFSLAQNYPNPFNPSTNIQFELPENAHVNISIYNMIGQKVVTLVNENMEHGQHRVTFDASSLTSGIYFYKISAGSFNQVRKMMFIK